MIILPLTVLLEYRSLSGDWTISSYLCRKPIGDWAEDSIFSTTLCGTDKLRKSRRHIWYLYWQPLSIEESTYGQS